MIKRFKKMEVAREDTVKVRVNGEEVTLLCTPCMLKELGAGVAATKFGLCNVRRVDVRDREVEVTASKLVSRPKRLEKLTEKLNLKELEESLDLLDVKEYRKTRGYHIAVAIRNGEVIARSYDVSRHCVLAKVIGGAILRGAMEGYYIVFSGRISRSIVEMCSRAGVNLIVSKAAIFDSAIDMCLKSGVGAVSFATGVAVNVDLVI